MSNKTLFHFSVILFLFTLNAISFAGDRDFPQKDFSHGKRSCTIVRNPKKFGKKRQISFQQFFLSNPDNTRHREPNPLADIIGRSAFSSSSPVSDSKSQLSKHDVKQMVFGEEIAPQTKKRSQRHFLRKKNELQRAINHRSQNHFSGTIKQPQSYSKHARKKYVASVSSSLRDVEQQKRSLSFQKQEKQQRAAYLKSIRYNGKYPRHLAGKPGPSRQHQYDAKIKRIGNTFYSDQVQQ